MKQDKTKLLVPIGGNAGLNFLFFTTWICFGWIWQKVCFNQGDFVLVFLQRPEVIDQAINWWKKLKAKWLEYFNQKNYPG